MNLRVAIPLTMVVSFALTCAFSIWVRKASDQAPAPRVNAGPTAANRFAPVAAPPLRVLPSEPSDSAPRPASEARRAVPEAVPAKLELPVQINYRRGQGAQTYVATLISKAEDAITLDVSIFNPARRRAAETQVSIEPMQVKRIGVDDGLEIEPGDRITLHNPTYSDLVEEIRAR